jgi:hypothetical protein
MLRGPAADPYHARREEWEWSGKRTDQDIFAA